MNRRVRSSAVAFLVFALLGVGLIYWHSTATSQSSPQETASKKTELSNFIVTEQPATKDFSLLVPCIGDVQGQSSVQLIAMNSGLVTKLQAKDESSIKAGDVIMRIGGANIDSKKAGLKATINSVQSQLPLAQQRVDRLQQSLKEQLATRDELAAAQQAQIQLETQLQEAQLALDSLEKQSTVTAPVSGILTARKVNVGQAVNAGEVVAEIADPNHLRVTASLFPPGGVPLEGKTAEIRLNGRKISGTVTSVLPQVSETGATTVWIEGPEIDRSLRSGETVSGELIAETYRTALAVPESAVLYGPDEQPYVFVQEKTDYERRPLKLGLIQNGYIQVLSGLRKDESVVVQGAYQLSYQNFNQQFKVED